MRLIPLISAGAASSAIVCVLACGGIGVAQADWTSRSLDSSYYSGTGSFETPPPGGWDEVLEREMKQEQARRDREATESQQIESQAGVQNGAASQPVPAAPAKADTCDDQPPRQNYGVAQYRSPGMNTQRGNSRRNGGDYRSQRGRSARGFGMPWGGERGGFGMPWGWDRGGPGFDSFWDDDRGWPDFDTPWRDSGPGDRGNRGGGNGRRDSWYW